MYVWRQQLVPQSWLHHRWSNYVSNLSGFTMVFSKGRINTVDLEAGPALTWDMWRLQHIILMCSIQKERRVKNKLGFHYQRNVSFLTDRLNQAAFSAVIKSISYRMWYPLGYDQKSSVMTEKLRIFTWQQEPSSPLILWRVTRGKH